VTRFTATTLAELKDAIGEALAAGEPLELVGGGTKRGLGRPLQLPRTLDLSRLSGIRAYEPSELVLTAGAATPLAEIEAALAEGRQMLAFEPPDWGLLYGLSQEEAGRATLGGALAANLSGPRRVKAGAARDHFLGFRAVSGRGEVFKAGGKVVKNVTGYDLPKLMAGSFGTLAALEEVTVKVLPRPESETTVLLLGLEPEEAQRRLDRALASPLEISGAAYLPAAAAAALPAPSGLPAAVALRLEGPAPSLAGRRERLQKELAGECESSVLDDADSAGFWKAIGAGAPFLRLSSAALWRVAAAPSRGAAMAAAIGRSLEIEWFLDWGGGLLWLAVRGAAADGGAAAIREALHGAGGRESGHATLIRGAPGLRRKVAPFEPQTGPLAALSRRVKESFDPCRILNPGRMVAEG
jgi:glycolate dehydrogenase FAD-binding subunit